MQPQARRRPLSTASPGCPVWTARVSTPESLPPASKHPEDEVVAFVVEQRAFVDRARGNGVPDMKDPWELPQTTTPTQSGMEHA